jgi:hypothetical protein
MKNLALLLSLILSGVSLEAHNVKWFYDLSEPPTTQPVRLLIRPGILLLPSGVIGVVPGDNAETCTVTVNLSPLDADAASLLDVSVRGGPFAAQSKYIDVRLKQLPSSFSPTVLHVKGTWQATGLPLNGGCTAIFPNEFDVPIQLGLSPEWLLAFDAVLSVFTIDTGGRYIGLQEACSPLGPWYTVGLGPKFMLSARERMGGRYYRDNTALGGDVWGTTYDGSWKPQSGITIDFWGGGAGMKSDLFGNYRLEGFPWGDNQLHISKLITLDKIDYKVGLQTLVPSKDPFTRFDYAFDANAGLVPGGQYMGWCAIGVARINSGQPAVYFNGGLRRLSKDVPWNPTGLQISVIQADGTTLNVERGQGEEDREIENAKPGTYMVKLQYLNFITSATGVVQPP